MEKNRIRPIKSGKSSRMSYSRQKEVLQMPNLIEVQKDSYQWFLDEGLNEVFDDISPITDYSGHLSLEFVDFTLCEKDVKYTIEECKERDATYAAPLKVRVRLHNKETDEINEHEIFMGDLPLMTSTGTFVINGAERVIVSQLVRSPGIYYAIAHDKLGKKPKAVIVVHLYGICAHIKEILKICRKYKVPLIEDAAESMGSVYHGQYTGTFGDYGIISFNGNKIITTSGGGMLLVNTEDAADKAAKVRYWSTQAREPERWYQHTEIGYNYRMSNIVAGIGRGQLKVLDSRIEKKRYIFEYYKKYLQNFPGLYFMPVPEESQSNYWLTVLQLDENSSVKPLDIIKALEDDDVESRPVWKPLHLQPVFSEYDFVSLVNECHITDGETGADSSISGKIFACGVCVPSDTKMTDEDLERVCKIIKELWK